MSWSRTLAARMVAGVVHQDGGRERGTHTKSLRRVSRPRDVVQGCYHPVTQDHQCHWLLFPQRGLPGGLFIPGCRRKAVFPYRETELFFTNLSWETFLL